MKELISNVIFRNYNGQDNLYFDVEMDLGALMKSKPMYHNEKILYEGTRNAGKLFVDIWKCGFARFGFTQFADPMHGNEEYTWSSNSDCVNREFNLIGTPMELARYGAGVRESRDEGCYFAIELTRSLALEIGENNKDKLHWGIEQYRLTIDSSAPYIAGRREL